MPPNDGLLAVPAFTGHTAVVVESTAVDEVASRGERDSASNDAMPAASAIAVAVPATRAVDEGASAASVVAEGVPTAAVTTGTNDAISRPPKRNDEPSAVDTIDTDSSQAAERDGPSQRTNDDSDMGAVVIETKIEASAGSVPCPKSTDDSSGTAVAKCLMCGVVFSTPLDQVSRIQIKPPPCHIECTVCRP